MHGMVISICTRNTGLFIIDYYKVTLIGLLWCVTPYVCHGGKLRKESVVVLVSRHNVMSVSGDSLLVGPSTNMVKGERKECLPTHMTDGIGMGLRMSFPL